jgi:hypothetical protein
MTLTARRLGVRSRWAGTLARTIGLAVFAAALLIGLLAGGLEVAPRVGLAAQEAAGPPRRPPAIAPAVPVGAPEEWAVWSYFDKVGPIWGRDWPTVIALLEDLHARYPGNPYTIEKLYAAYVEDGKWLARLGEADAARHRYQQAIELDPDRGEAPSLLDELDASPERGRP